MTPYYYSDEACVIYHGDCREVLSQIAVIDHVITDPPYARDVYIRMSFPSTNAGSGSVDRAGSELKQTYGDPIYTLRDGGAYRRMGAGEIGHVDEMRDDIARLIVQRTRRWMLVFCDVESVHLWKKALTEAGAVYRRTGAWVKPDAMPQMTGDRPA